VKVTGRLLLDASVVNMRAEERLSSQEKFTVNSVPKPFIKDRISSSSAAPFMAT
jgi:hypothetical protein